MTKPEKALPFEASANLQRLIGRELVPTVEAALVELVKNAYDAGAHHVWITFQPPLKKEPGYFEIKDDGTGMTRDELSKLFMRAGYSERPKQLGRARVPTGEKGIGRFAADRLGHDLEVLTKPDRASNDVHKLHVNWDDFDDRTKLFSDVSADLSTIKNVEFGANDRGTILRITRLRETNWTAEKLQAMRTSLSELLNPLHPPDDFSIELDIIGSKHSGVITNHVPEEAEIDISFSILANGKIRRRVKGKDPVDIAPPNDAKSLAGLKGRFLYYKRQPSKRVTRLTPGVWLYRDGFRVEPLGSPASDWLGISEKRAKRAGHAHIVPSRLFGFIEISRKDHKDLKDTTSRQALLANDEVRVLVDTLQSEVSFLENKIEQEIDAPRWKISRERQAAEFEAARFQALGLLSMGLAHELRQPLQAIMSESDNIVKRLAQLKVKDPDITSSQKSIESGVNRMNKTIEVISDISKGDLDDVSEIDLVQIVKDQLIFHETRSATSGIKLILHLPPKQIARFNKSAVHTVLLNLVRNSIEALEERDDDVQRVVSITVSKEGRKHVISVEDNGPGIPEESREKIFKQFTTKKTSGLGIGLSMCKLTIGKFGGDIYFETEPMVATTFTITFSDLREK